MLIIGQEVVDVTGVLRMLTVPYWRKILTRSCFLCWGLIIHLFVILIICFDLTLYGEPRLVGENSVAALRMAGLTFIDGVVFQLCIFNFKMILSWKTKRKRRVKKNSAADSFQQLFVEIIAKNKNVSLFSNFHPMNYELILFTVSLQSVLISQNFCFTVSSYYLFAKNPVLYLYKSKAD